jgi:hypothetical protein
LTNVKSKVEGDLLYGDMIEMEKFCNSLHVRLLMRISNKVNVSAKLNEIVTKPTVYHYSQSNTDNAAMCGSYQYFTYGDG